MCAVKMSDMSRAYVSCMCDMKHSYVSYICDMTHSYVLWIRDKTPAYAGDEFICYMTHACVWRRRYVTHTHDFYVGHDSCIYGR